MCVLRRVPCLLPAFALQMTCAACGGSGKLAMPELRGKSERQAFRVLAAHHLCAVLDPSAYWPQAMRARPGTVVDQDPTPGSRINPGTTVTIWVRHIPEEDTLGGVAGCPGPVFRIKNVAVSD
jgi:beta-lactam-binding protein with PASTA domain